MSEQTKPSKQKDYDAIYPVSYPLEGAGGKTGGWRIFRPELDAERCIKCQFCWIYCPDGVIDRQTLAIDYEYCKGCGICAQECPKQAISMVRED